MRVLGIDSATAKASVGLWVDGVVVAEQHTSSRNHAASLLPLIDAVLRNGEVSLPSIDLLAVSTGPGSFSGLRVALSVVKGIALASDTQVVSVSTLEALAATVVDQGQFICSLLDAHKGEVYFACFESRQGQLLRHSDDVVVRPEIAVQSLPRPCAIVGDAAAQYEVIQQSARDGVTILPFPEFGPCGGTVARLGARQFESSGGVSAATLEPFYVRPPEVRLSI